MADLTSVELATVNNETVTLGQVLHQAKINGELTFVGDAIRQAVLAQAIKQRRLTTSAAELQGAANLFRSSHHLNKVQDTEAWLKANNMTVDEFEAGLEMELLIGKLKEQIVAEKVEPYFNQNRLLFERARLSHILVGDENTANQLLQELDDNASFADLAETHSLDEETRLGGGYLGVVGRKELALNVESAVFGAATGEIVGPVKTDQGYHLIKVWELKDASLDEATKGEISNILFEEWREQELAEAKIEMKLDI